jgi:23S rRNA pseudouridine1911/1915/1917 synthase
VSVRFDVDSELAGERLDVAVAAREPGLSRSQIRRLIERGAIRVAHAGAHADEAGAAKPAQRLRVGDRVLGELPPPEPDALVAEAIPLDVVFEDGALLVVNKPAGMVVHPSAGHRQGTLVHALLHHVGDLSGIGGVLRPGIVHRLDKGTSGLLVCAKNDAAHQGLAAQFKAHTIDREYQALVRGAPRAERGSIDAPIGRHRSDHSRFTVREPRTPRHAVTHWRVERRLGALTLLRVTLETGRTHQIRVHLASVGLPIAGDPVYGGGRAAARAQGLERQALHAARLGFDHPRRGERVRFEAALPDDLRAVLERLGS